MTVTPTDLKRLLSVRDLVASRTSESDRWNLALVQRDEKWDTVRMRHLLDSMLARYPIGAILLCRVEDTSEVIDREGGVRTVRRASAAEWQLVDGQQRINAFYSMLTGGGRYGKFYLHMTMRREPPGPVQKRSTKDRHLPYIVWRAGDTIDEFPNREMHIDLSRWSTWASTKTTVHATPSDAAALLHDLDPEFANALTPESAEQAADRLNALWRAWTEPTVPALYAPVQSPADVLEIFTRVNLGGVDVVSSDVFFAAVKTYWSDAEARLDALHQLTAPFLADRMRALRFAARLASRAISSNDLLPLTVDRLSGPKPHPLVVAMDEITQPDSLVMRRVGAFTTWLRVNSRLGLALKSVTPDLFEDVLAWAAATEGTSGDYYTGSLEAIDSYLLGATIFRYPSVMRDTYRRMAFLECLTAGAAAEGFQTAVDRILTVARAGNGLRGGRSAVDTFGAARSRQVGRYHDGPVLTCLAQRLPLDQQDIDWDHIFPQAQATRMWVRGQRGRRAHHPKRPLVNAGGNFWALDAGANRALQDTSGKAKFQKLAEWEATGRIVARSQWSLTDHEIAEHVAVDELLDGTEVNIELAMARFSTLVESRSLRLWDEAVEAFPQIRRFAADHHIAGEDPSLPQHFAEALGVAPPPKATGGGGTGIAYANDWAEKGEQWLEWIVDELARNTLKLPKRRNGRTRQRSGFDYGWSIWLGEPGANTDFAFGLAPSRRSTSGSPFWIQVNSRTDGWETVAARLEASEFSSMLEVEEDEDSDVKRMWIPLDAAAHLDWHGLLRRLREQAVPIRDTITGAGLPI